MSTATRKLKRLRERGVMMREATVETTEACASFARKFSLQNYGGPQYESIDFFASRKLTCRSDIRQMVSEALFQECVVEVETAAREYMIAAKARNWKSMVPPPIGKGNAAEFEAWQKKQGAKA